jgi:tRNA dimethylallyltransferase
MTHNHSTALILLGPTASGKSRLALKIADALKGVLINADSMQVYKNFPILSACPSDEDFEQCPHRLYGVFDLEKNEQCSASKWAALAQSEIQQAFDQGKLPILVGGTGFYIKALLEGLSPIPEIPSGVRETLSNILQNDREREKLYRHLQETDPETARKVNVSDTQRLTRALEVLLHTGKPLSFWNSQPQKTLMNINYRIITLTPERETLYQTINERAKKMLEQGAIEEVKSFVKKNVKVSTIGYGEIRAYLEGTMTQEAMLDKLQQKTRNYAKRQTTWIRHQIHADLTIDPLRIRD